MKYTNIKQWVINSFWLLSGTFITAAGLNLFLVPNKVSVGGVSTVATILLYVFKLPLSITNLAMNIILLICALRYLNKTAIINTVLSIISLSFFLEITKQLPSLTNDFIIASILGGTIMGTGVGIVLRHNSSTGGSDLAAMILNRIFPHISIANNILIIDAVVMLFAIIVFKDIYIIFYSVVSIFVFTKVVDLLLTMGTSAKSVYIFSEKPEELSINIMARVKRGVTGISSTGMYSSLNKTMLLCIVSAKELPELINLIRKSDKKAFIIVSDVREVLGTGFKSGSNYD